MGAPIGSRERARYWELRASGWTQSSAAAEIGAHVNTVRKWERDTRYAKAENASLARSIDIADSSSGGAAMSDAANEPRSRKELSNKAKRALEDFDYFRRRYLARCPSPWQVDAAYKIVDLLHTDEREFLILNCPPGAGKSTLWHGIAVWMIVRDRSIRILIGSVSSTLANQYSARIRDTLERTAPVRPCAVAIALDRQERAVEDGRESAQSAVQFVRRQFAIEAVAIATMADLLAVLGTSGDASLAAFAGPVAAYRDRYGV